MDVGVMVPQGWKGEFDGWRPADAWANAVERAQQAEALGFESIWVFDHFTTVPVPTPCRSPCGRSGPARWPARVQQAS